mmetsp:Transcript_11405/g.22620  ORF Transcript_11405/g.22620 Transcript_11405/m.22620 type:complete len:335 (+) Transcript_11405:132-1136(+)
MISISACALILVLLPSVPALLATGQCGSSPRSRPKFCCGVRRSGGFPRAHREDSNRDGVGRRIPPDGTSRRRVLGIVSLAAPSLLPTAPSVAAAPGRLYESSDPATYPCLVYAPPGLPPPGGRPLLLVLHGAGINTGTAQDLADPAGEHAGLPPSLLATGLAPAALSENFYVVAPYSAGKRSFYEEPRKKLLEFLSWATSDAGPLPPGAAVDRRRIFLLGFSDGATVGVELMTTRRFAGSVIAAYGLTGSLPDRAVELLRGIPMWVFHSADDVIFPVRCSDGLVGALRGAVGDGVVRYTRFDKDQEGFTGAVRGHSTGITASKMSAVYEWMLSI